MFHLYSKFKPIPAQLVATEKIATNIKEGKKNQVLLGVTGCGKTFVMANVIEKVQKPVLIISHNKTLAAQLYQEFKEFFPKNAVLILSPITIITNLKLISPKLILISQKMQKLMK